MKTSQRVGMSKNYYKLLKTCCDLKQRTINKEQGCCKHVENIQKEYLERELFHMSLTTLLCT